MSSEVYEYLCETRSSNSIVGMLATSSALAVKQQISTFDNIDSEVCYDLHQSALPLEK